MYIGCFDAFRFRRVRFDLALSSLLLSSPSITDAICSLRCFANCISSCCICFGGVESAASIISVSGDAGGCPVRHSPNLNATRGSNVDQLRLNSVEHSMDDDQMNPMPRIEEYDIKRRDIKTNTIGTRAEHFKLME